MPDHSSEPERAESHVARTPAVPAPTSGGATPLLGLTTQGNHAFGSFAAGGTARSGGGVSLARSAVASLPVERHPSDERLAAGFADVVHRRRGGAAGTIARLPIDQAAPAGPAADSRPALAALIAQLEHQAAEQREALGPDATASAELAQLEQLIDRMRAVADSGDQQMMDRVLSGFTGNALAAAENAAATGASPLPATDAAVAPTTQPGGDVAPGVARTSAGAPPARLQRVAMAAPLVGVGVAAGPPGWVVLGVAALAVLAIGGVIYMSRPGRPTGNTDQNKQFADAVREIERRLGRRLTADEKRRLHEELHHYDDPGYHDIVEIGIGLFGGAAAGGADD